MPYILFLVIVQFILILNMLIYYILGFNTKLYISCSKYVTFVIIFIQVDLHCNSFSDFPSGFYCNDLNCVLDYFLGYLCLVVCSFFFLAIYLGCVKFWNQPQQIFGIIVLCQQGTSCQHNSSFITQWWKYLSGFHLKITMFLYLSCPLGKEVTGCCKYDKIGDFSPVFLFYLNYISLVQKKNLT